MLNLFKSKGVVVSACYYAYADTFSCCSATVELLYPSGIELLMDNGPEILEITKDISDDIVV